MIDWPRFVEVILAHQRFLLTSHVRPDCDALGSELAMAEILEALGKQVVILNADPMPENLGFLDPQQRIQSLHTDISPDAIPEVDVLMVLDTSAWKQLGEMGDVLRKTAAKKIVLDHHESSDDLEAELFKDEKSEATGRLVYEAARQLGVPFTETIANALLAAITTDTGWFRFSSTNSGTLRAAGDLVDAGGDLTTLYRELFEQESVARLQIFGRVMARVQAELDGTLMHTAVLAEDFQITGALPSDTEGLVNRMLQVSSAEAAILFLQLPDQETFKISFRSRGDFLDCSDLAELFGGGGHINAAGATVAGTLDEVRNAVITAAKKMVQQTENPNS